MSDEKKKILVPTDFTKVADCAMNHAMKLAERTGAEVCLFHVVDKPAHIEEVLTKLNMEVDRARVWSSKVTVTPLVRVGSVYEDIGDAAAEIGATLIIMGTHGMRGMQFITGSRALRVITNSTVPFIVVQERNVKEAGYRDIVVPMDLHKETRHKLTLVADMAQYFKSRVHLVVPKENDEFLHNQLVNHMKFANTFLKDRGIEHESAILDEGSDDFVKGVIRYAVKMDADLIAIVNMLQESLFGVLGVPNEQEIITNEPMVPVMCMNPLNNTVSNMPVWGP
ncbi:MAG: universal stress protein [Flavobacteriales bacterium]|nr:universal stress protein [Flavobacteriales bacterium]MBL0036264.1 universal stress protein [Flavobacteriales bacterium]